MTKSRHRIIIFLLIVVVLVGAGALYRHRVNKVYYSILNNQSLIQAANDNNDARLNQIASSRGIFVQKFINYQPATNYLPQVDILNYHQISDNNVLTTSTLDYLKATQPYAKWKSHHVWLAIAYFQSGSNGNGYVLIKRAI